MSLRAVAKEVTKGLSDLFEGREKLEKEARNEMLSKELTVKDFDIVDYEDGTDRRNPHKHYAVFVFVEAPEIAYCGGQQLTNIVDSYVEETGSIDNARAEYQADVKAGEPLKIILNKVVTGSGNDFIKVEVR